jgi:hypothetical protein
VKRTFFVLLMVAAASCSRSSSRSAEGAGSASGTSAVPAVREAKDLLADGKVVAGFAIYQQEVAPLSGKAMEAFAAIATRTGRDPKKMAEAAKSDPAIVEFNKVNEAALAKAGISQSDVQTLSRALSAYMAEVYVARGASDEATQTKAAEDKFLAAYGAAALETVKKNQAALLAAQDKMMESMVKK